MKNNLSYLSVIHRVDEDDVENSLKTGSRSVTVLPGLSSFLTPYLPQLETEWLIPTSDGKRFLADSFTRKLLTVNAQHGLP